MLKAGMILMLEWGTHPDSETQGPFRVMKDFDQTQAVNDFKAHWNPTPGGTLDPHDPEGAFKDRLIATGLIRPIDAVSWDIEFGREVRAIWAKQMAQPPGTRSP